MIDASSYAVAKTIRGGPGRSLMRAPASNLLRRHRDVKDDQIGMSRASGLDSRLAIGDRSDHLEVGCQQGGNPRPRFVVIFRYLDARSGHVAGDFTT